MFGKFFSKGPEKKDRPTQKPQQPNQLSPLPIEKLSAGMQKRVEATTQVLERQLRISELKDVSIEDPGMQKYYDWVFKQSRVIVEMQAPWMKSGVYLHLKKGGIFYLEPLGVYFFPTNFFMKKKGSVHPQASGFWVNAQHCADVNEVSDFLETQVCQIGGDGFMVSSSSDQVKPVHLD